MVTNNSPIRFYKNGATNIEEAYSQLITGHFTPQKFLNSAQTQIFSGGEELSQIVFSAGDFTVNVGAESVTPTFYKLYMTKTGKAIIRGVGSGSGEYGINIYKGEDFKEQILFNSVLTDYEIEVDALNYSFNFFNGTLSSKNISIARITQVYREKPYVICGENYKAKPLNLVANNGRRINSITTGEIDIASGFWADIVIENNRKLKFEAKGDGQIIVRDELNVTQQTINLTFDYETYEIEWLNDDWSIEQVINSTSYIKNIVLLSEIIYSTYQEITPYGYAWELSTLDHSTDLGYYSIQFDDYTSEPIEIVEDDNLKEVSYIMNSWRNCALKNYEYRFYLPIKIDYINKNESSIFEGQNTNNVVDAFNVIGRKINITESIIYYQCDILQNVFNFDVVKVDNVEYAKTNEAEQELVNNKAFYYNFSIEVRKGTYCNQVLDLEPFECPTLCQMLANSSAEEISNCLSPTQIGIICGGDAIECEDATITLNEAEFLSVTSGGSQDIILVDQDLTPIVPTITANEIKVNIPRDIYIRAYFKDTNDIMEDLEIDEYTAGTYTSSTNDGNTGIVTYKINTVVTSLPFTLISGDELIMTRTTHTVSGWSQLNGSYV